jgi:hypothetical protein
MKLSQLKKLIREEIIKLSIERGIEQAKRCEGKLFEQSKEPYLTTLSAGTKPGDPRNESEHYYRAAVVRVFEKFKVIQDSETYDSFRTALKKSREMSYRVGGVPIVLYWPRSKGRTPPPKMWIATAHNFALEYLP